MTTITFMILAACAVCFISPAAEAQTCGSNNQRPCTILERIPSCNSGLVEDFRKGLCVKQSVPGVDCGRANQRPCTVVERIPSCNSGLVEDFKKNLCVNRAVPGVDCGRESQRPCAVFERIPSCNANLKEDFARGICVSVPCGKEQDRPCTVVERIPSCDQGLVEDFLKNRCVKSEERAKQEIAGKKFGEIADFVASKLSFATGVTSDPDVERALESDNPAAVELAVNPSQAGPTAMPDGNLIRTLTVGASGGAKVIIGGSAGAGAAIDLTGNRPVYAYGTADYSIGFGVGANAGSDVGFWVCQNNKIGGDSWAVEFGPSDIIGLAKVLKGVEGAKLSDIVKPGFDVGVALWFGYDNVFQGFTLSPGVGVGADFGNVVYATTAVEDDPTVNCDGTPVVGGATRFIQDIFYSGSSGSGVIRHLSVDNGASDTSVTRVCLVNRTSRAKGISYSVSGVNPLNASTVGSQTCANFPSSLRLEFNFMDNGRSVRSDAMNLSAYAGDIVRFEWASD